MIAYWREKEPSFPWFASKSCNSSSVFRQLHWMECACVRSWDVKTNKTPPISSIQTSMYKILCKHITLRIQCLSILIFPKANKYRTPCTSYYPDNCRSSTWFHIEFSNIFILQQPHLAHKTNSILYLYLLLSTVNEKKK